VARRIRRLRWRAGQLSALALGAGLLVTAGLTLITLAVYNRNERRLLQLRVRELNLVIADTVPPIQTSLASAAVLANATAGNRRDFRAFMSPQVGAGRQFASASLWSIRGGRPRLLVTIGAAPKLAAQPAYARRFFKYSAPPGVLNLTHVLGPRKPTLGLEFSAPGPAREYAVYAENALPASRRSRIESNSAFSDLYYVLYLGRSRRTRDLLVTNVNHLPIRGRQASDTVPFGSAKFTLVVAPKGSLAGTFFRLLPWIIALVGALLSCAAGVVTDRLARGRRRAEKLAQELDRTAAENRRMYAQQRTISHTLQHALLPDRLPEVQGLDLAALYVPASGGVEVGGDWYDVVQPDGGRVFLIIGDVSGHGLQAATTMALLRHATLAYVAEGGSPAQVLSKLSHFVGKGLPAYFATVLCAKIDVDAHRLTVASAGHMPPLLLDGRGGEFMKVQIGAPIGVPREGARFHELTAAVSPGAALVAFTDGLVERRGEVLDVGLERLRTAASGTETPIEDLLARLAHELAREDHHDDTAMVGVQWKS
jgi:serine phosphatase RsbU (regulator of sigma subunit)